MREIIRYLRAFSFLVLASALCLSAQPAQAQAKIDVKLGLDWAFQGTVAMLLYGLEQGYFSDEGLNVTIDRGYGSADAVTKVASGAYQFVLGDVNSVVEFNARNPEKQVVAVFMKYNRPPFSVVTFADRGINTPADLQGRKVASNEGLAARRMFPLFAKGAGVDVSKIEWVNVAPPMLDTIVLQKSADAGIGFWNTQSLNMKAAKVPSENLKSFLYSDYGVDLYGNAVLTTKRFAAENPDVVKRFNRAVTKCMMAVAKDPAVSIPALKRREPAAVEAIELERLKITLDDFIITKETETVGIGGVDTARLERAIAQLATVMDLPSKPAPNDVFDPSFLPDLKDRLVKR